MNYRNYNQMRMNRMMLDARKSPPIECKPSDSPLTNIGKECLVEDSFDDRVTCLMATGDLEIFDNGGETVDRFSVFIGQDVFHMSDNALMPNGVNMYAGDRSEMSVWLRENQDEKKMMDNVPKLPEQVKKAILRRALE